MTSKGNGREPSMDEIMAQIRSIIAADESKGRPAMPRGAEKSGAEKGGDGEVLDLTEMVNDDGSVTKVSGPQANAPAPKSGTIIEPEQGFTSMPAPPADLAPIFANAGPIDGPPMPQAQPMPQPRPAAPPPVAAAPPPVPPPAPAAPKPAPPPVIVQTNTPQPALQPAIVMPPAAPPPPRPQPGPSPTPMSDLLSNAAAGAAASALERLAAVNQQQQAKPPAPPPGPAMPSIGGRSVEDVVQEMLRPMLKQWLDANLPGIVERMVAQEIAKISKR